MQDHSYHLRPNYGILFLPKFQPLDREPAPAGRLIAFWAILRQQLLNEFLSLAVNAQFSHVINRIQTVFTDTVFFSLGRQQSRYWLGS